METYDFKDVHDRLDDRRIYARIEKTPWYPGAEYHTFSHAEFERRHRLVREKMDRLGLDVLLAPGGPDHWSYGGGMMWLSGHWNWYCMVEYVVVPREGEPMLVYSQPGAHLEATRRESWVRDVRASRMGQFAVVMAERIRELGLEGGTIGIAETDWQFHEYIPANQYLRLQELLPEAKVELVADFFHELMVHKSPEEQAFVAKAGELAVKALYAVRDRAEPGVTEYQLAAAAARAILEEDGQLDFLIIGTTPMDDPAMVFGNPRPSHRVLREGDIILNELAAGYQGYTAQIGMPICLAQPNDRVRRFFDEVVLPGFLHMERTLRPGNDLEEIRLAGRFYREHDAQSRPILLHGMDFVSNSPHVTLEHVDCFPYERIMKPGATLMLEPCAITDDGLLGMFYGHTYVITEDGARRVTDCPHELLVAGG